MKVLFVLFISLSLYVCMAWTESRSQWLDINDPHNYDHVNKKMKNKDDGSSSQLQCKSCEPHDRSQLIRCETNLESSLDASRKEKQTSKFLLGMLQRQTVMVLKAAGLLEEDYADRDSLFHQGYLLLSVSKDHLRTLRSFASLGKFDLEELDAAWRDMLSPVQDPNRSKWSWVRRWLPLELFSISKETFILCLECGVVICPMVMLALGMSLRRVIATFVFLLVLVSVVLRYHRVMQAAEFRMQHMLVDPSQMPPECRPHKLSWMEAFKMFFTTEDPAVKCARYYERTYTDPVTQNTPIEQLVNLLMDIIESFFARMGSATKQLCDAAFADLPWPFNTIVCTVAKLGSVILLVVMFVVMLWYSVTGCGSGIGRRAAERIVADQPREALTPPPPVNVTNHIHLTLSRGTDGIEAIENISTQSNQHGKFLRTQSEGSISFSSQSTSSVVPQNFSTEDSSEETITTRARSASEGTFSGAKSQNLSIGNSSMKAKSSSPPSTNLTSDCSKSEQRENSTILEEEENVTNNCDDNIDIVESEMETEVASPSRSETSSLSPNTSCLADYLESLQLDESMEVTTTTPNEVTGPLLETIEAELSQFEIVENCD